MSGEVAGRLLKGMGIHMLIADLPSQTTETKYSIVKQLSN